MSSSSRSSSVGSIIVIFQPVMPSSSIACGEDSPLRVTTLWRGRVHFTAFGPAGRG
jgi:hypothetical protein